MPTAPRQPGICARSIALAGAGLVFCAARAQDRWACVAGDFSHTGVSNSVALPLGGVRGETAPASAWIASVDEQGRQFTAIASQTPVFDSECVYICGRVVAESGPIWRLLAIRRSDGTTRWGAPIPAPVVDSFSSATLDAGRNRVIIAAARNLIAINASDGTEAWRFVLTRNVVNASAIIADDLLGRARAFITDYDGFGVAASLYCINLDVRSASNPFDPGELIWRVPIGGASGATPAFLAAEDGGVGLVYVATRGEPGFMPGNILAFDAYADAAPMPAFIATNTIDEGFYGIVAVAPASFAGAGPTLYAVSYEFYGGLNSANLIAVDGASGQVRWSIASNRGASAPVVLGNGRIAVSAGVQGYGTLPSVALYVDRRDHAVELWNSAMDTWIDGDGDGLIDLGECDSVGLWSYQPIASRDLGLLCVGVAPDSAVVSGFGSSIATLDVTLSPKDREFCRRSAGASGSPSAGRGWFYAIGANGLAAYRMSRVDINADARTTIDDLVALERGVGDPDRRDVNGDGAVDAMDRAELVHRLRAHEAARMTTRRP